MILALNFTKSLCLVLLRPAEASLMLNAKVICMKRLYQKSCFFALADILHKITNAVGLREDLAVSVAN